MRLAAVAPLLFAFAGCATSSATPGLGRGDDQMVGVQGRSGAVSRVDVRTEDQTRAGNLAMDYERAWALLPTLLQDLGLSVGSIDPSTGRVSHRGERVRRINGKRMSEYLDCGMGSTAQPYANLYEVALGYEVVMRRSQRTGIVEVEMRVEATAKPQDVSGNALRCTSEGTLERLVFQRLQAGASGALPRA